MIAMQVDFKTTRKWTPVTLVQWDDSATLVLPNVKIVPLVAIKVLPTKVRVSIVT
jgi:hypothetical protein